MNIYHISLKSHNYDEYDSWIVFAKNEEDVKRLCDIRKEKGEPTGTWKIEQNNQYEDNIEFIKLIGVTINEEDEGIVLGSFNAG
jgi:hypothetical protein